MTWQNWLKQTGGGDPKLGSGDSDDRCQTFWTSEIWKKQYFQVYVWFLYDGMFPSINYI